MSRRWAGSLIGCLLTLLTVARSPETLTTPQFYAEDGALFFQQAYSDGFLPTLTRPTAGYLNTLPRLLAGGALLAPLGQAPLALALLALLVQMLPVFYLLSDRAAGRLPSFPGRAIAALIYVVAPNSDEVYVSATNSQWHLNIVAALVLLLPPPARAVARWAEWSLMAIFAFTGPGSIVLLPVALLRLHRARPAGERRYARALAALVFLGAAVQLSFLATGQRLATAAAPSLSLAQLAGVLANHALFTVFFREESYARICGSFGTAQHLFGLALLAGLAAAALRRGRLPLLLLGYLALATIALSLLFPSNALAEWLDPFFGPRYFFYAALFVAYAVFDLAAARGVRRALGVALALPLLAFGVLPGFFHAPWFDTRYRDQIAQFETLPPGASFFVPTLPEGWGMTLVRKADSRPAGSPLEGLRPLPESARYRLDPVWVSEAGDMISVSGVAADPRTGAKAGGVFISVDGRLFPACYGRARTPRPGKTVDRAATAFHRIIPVAEIGRGVHGVAVIVVAPDRSGYFQPAEPQFFTLT